MKKLILLLLVAIPTTFMAGCDSDADVASKNLSKAADNFEVYRHIVFFNGITDKVLVEVTGLCSVGNNDSTLRMSVTCKTGSKKYQKHIFGLSDNVSFFSEDLGSTNVSTQRYRVIIKPSTLIPDFDLR